MLVQAYHLVTDCVPFCPACNGAGTGSNLNFSLLRNLFHDIGQIALIQDGGADAACE